MTRGTPRLTECARYRRSRRSTFWKPVDKLGWRCASLDGNKAGFGRPESNVAKCPVFGRLVPALKLRNARELDDHETLRYPVAFEYLGRAGASQIAAAMSRNRCRH